MNKNYSKNCYDSEQINQYIPLWHICEKTITYDIYGLFPVANTLYFIIAYQQFSKALLAFVV